MTTNANDFPELQRPQAANAWRINARVTTSARSTEEDQITLIKNLTDALLAMNTAGSNNEDDIKSVVEKCVNAEREHKKVEAEVNKAADKMIKRLKDQFVFYGETPLYTIDNGVVLIDDLTHKGWDKFKVQICDEDL